ncbi:serine protease [Rhodanobacter glycinis]|uniref:S1 family peptidase n=1 Tax=Rhodanobacter glycinis TaxID=582702 RepID=UPI00112D7CF2|nr:serine protease [Rhodanobacter glycinis]TPG50181.1 serine protease [Rhodanobacter glycinis]
MRILAALLCVGLSGCISPMARVHKATVLLTIDNGTCSGTIIGPHAILTAEHCLTRTKTLAVDSVPVEVLSVVLDHRDHAIVRVLTTYKHWVEVKPEVYQGEEIFNLGNPGNLRDMYRHGYVSGYAVIAGQMLYILDYNGYFGDSGSGIFSMDGKLVAVTSVLDLQLSPNGFIKVMGAFPLMFTKTQLDEVTR